MDNVQKVKAEGHMRLFYQVSKGRNTYADAAGKLFSRLVDIARMLTGHSESGVHGKVYVHRENIKLSVLLEGMNRLRYDDVVKALNNL